MFHFVFCSAAEWFHRRRFEDSAPKRAHISPSNVSQRAGTACAPEKKLYSPVDGAGSDGSPPSSASSSPDFGARATSRGIGLSQEQIGSRSADEHALSINQKPVSPSCSREKFGLRPHNEQPTPLNRRIIEKSGWTRLVYFHGRRMLPLPCLTSPSYFFSFSRGFPSSSVHLLPRFPGSCARGACAVVATHASGHAAEKGFQFSWECRVDAQSPVNREHKWRHRPTYTSSVTKVLLLFEWLGECIYHFKIGKHCSTCAEDVCMHTDKGLPSFRIYGWLLLLKATVNEFALKM